MKNNPLISTRIYFPEKNQKTKHRVDVKKEEFYQEILKHATPIKNEIREENIFLLNTYQDSEIVEKMQANIITSPHEESRKLIAYYRGTQIDIFSQRQIQEIMHFVRYFVEQWYSQFFDEFAVLYRMPNEEFLKDFEKNSYLVKGEEFRILSNIFADTIHFSDGTPENIDGTFRILGTTPYKRNKWKFDNIIHLPLEYSVLPPSSSQRKKVLSPSEQKKLTQIQQPKNLERIFYTILQTIQNTEQIMTKKIKK